MRAFEQKSNKACFKRGRGKKAIKKKVKKASKKAVKKALKKRGRCAGLAPKQREKCLLKKVKKVGSKVRRAGERLSHESLMRPE